VSLSTEWQDGLRTRRSYEFHMARDSLENAGVPVYSAELNARGLETHVPGTIELTPGVGLLG
jgi:hypothetical protein